MKDEVEVLLVEDNISDAEMILRALKKNKLANRLVHLNDGAEALDFIFAEGNYRDRDTVITPKVILLDLKMPKVNGIEVLRKIKADERTKKIPVVVFTSSKEDSDIQACYSLGANGYVVKPVQFDDFINAISGLGFYWMTLNQSPK